MRFLTLFLFVSVSALASASTDHERSVIKRLNGKYDLNAVTAFLKTIIKQHPTFEDIPISSTKIGSDWVFEKADPPSRMRNGDWVIWDRREDDSAFELYYTYKPGYSVTIFGRRLGKDRFEVIRLSIEEWVDL